MNTPNNLEWLDRVLSNLTSDVRSTGGQVGSIVRHNEAKNAIATKLAEAYKQGGIDELKMAQANHNTEQMIGKYLEDRIATLTNEKELEQ